MTTSVFLAVLFAAALHAGWNSIVKVGVDRLAAITLTAVCASIVAAAIIPFVPLPSAESVPWLLLSATLHIGYNFVLARTYTLGDLGQMYPIARGTAPLLIALVMLLAGAEHLSTLAFCGVFVLAGGVALMSLRGHGKAARLPRAAVGYALVTSCFIAAYTISDGIGARVSGNPPGYIVWMFLFDGVLMLPLLVLLRGRRVLTVLRRHWVPGMVGGAMSLTGYGIVIWAMTMAPIALVAGLRETSVLFASLISVVILREPPTLWRSVAALVIVAGIVIIRLA